MKKRIIFLSFFLPAFLLSCTEEVPVEPEGPRFVRAIKVANPSVGAGAWIPGTSKAVLEVDLSFRVGGRMVSRPVQIGDALSAGDLVAKIDPTDYEVAARNAEGVLDEAKAAFRAAEADYQRVRNARQRDPGAASQSLEDRAREDRDRAQANIKSFEAALQDAQNRLGYTELTAPFEGKVVMRYVDPYTDVRATQPIIRLVDSSQIEFVINVSEVDVAYLPAVTNVIVELDAFPDRQFPATIKEIGTEASATTRTYPVTLLIEQPGDVEILPGMAGRATGEAEGFEELALKVPLAALFTLDEGGDPNLAGRIGTTSDTASLPTFVWVIDEQSMLVSRREVTTGVISQGGIEVLDGLSPGEWIATAGVHSLYDDQEVRIRQERTE